jgi:hypothetical protein
MENVFSFIPINVELVIKFYLRNERIMLHEASRMASKLQSSYLYGVKFILFYRRTCMKNMQIRENRKPLDAAVLAWLRE